MGLSTSAYVEDNYQEYSGDEAFAYQYVTVPTINKQVPGPEPLKARESEPEMKELEAETPKGPDAETPQEPGPEPNEPEPELEIVSELEIDVDSMSGKQLRKACSVRGLSTNGKRKKLQNRLRRFLKAKNSESEPELDGAHEIKMDVESMPVKQLREVCFHRGLSTKGNKKKLQKRLRRSLEGETKKPCPRTETQSPVAGDALGCRQRIVKDQTVFGCGEYGYDECEDSSTTEEAHVPLQLCQDLTQKVSNETDSNSKETFVGPSSGAEEQFAVKLEDDLEHGVTLETLENCSSVLGIMETTLLRVTDKGSNENDLNNKEIFGSPSSGAEAEFAIKLEDECERSVSHETLENYSSEAKVPFKIGQDVIYKGPNEKYSNQKATFKGESWLVEERFLIQFEGGYELHVRLETLETSPVEANVPIKIGQDVIYKGSNGKYSNQKATFKGESSLIEERFMVQFEDGYERHVRLETLESYPVAETGEAVTFDSAERLSEQIEVPKTAANELPTEGTEIAVECKPLSAKYHAFYDNFL